MTATVFVNSVTLTDAGWFNDADSVVYDLFGDGTNYTGRLIIADATDATSPTTGSAKTAGGLGVAKALWVGGLANIAGTLAVTGAISNNAGGGNGTLMDATGFFETTWPTTASAANGNVANGNYLRLVTSLRETKHDEQPISEEEAERTVMGLTGLLYRSRIDEDQRQWAGLIAEDTEAVNPVLCVYDEKGNLQSVTYDRVPAYLIPLAQAHNRRIEELRAEFDSYRSAHP